MSLSRHALIHLLLPLSILVFLHLSQTVCLALVPTLVCTFPPVALYLFKKVSTQYLISVSPWPHEQWHNQSKPKTPRFCQFLPSSARSYLTEVSSLFTSFISDPGLMSSGITNVPFSSGKQKLAKYLRNAGRMGWVFCRGYMTQQLPQIIQQQLFF